VRGRKKLVFILVICSFPYSALAIEPPSSVADASAELLTPLAQQSTPNQNPPSPITPELSPPTLDDVEPILPSLPESPPPEPDLVEPSEESIIIQKIQIQGNSLFQAEIDRIRDRYTKLLRGRTINREQLYLNGGYLTSRALVLNYNLTEGIVVIQVREGSLPEANIAIESRTQNEEESSTGESQTQSEEESGTVESRPRLEAYTRDRILLGANTPLRLSELEDQLRLLRADSTLFENVEASLRFSGTVAESNLDVTLIPADPWQVSLGVDNYSPPSVGSERASISLGYRSLFTIGDSVTAYYSRTFPGGADVIDLGYRIPVNPRDGAIQLRATFDFTNVTEAEFEEFNIEGESRNYEISFRQPLIRNPREELGLSLGFSYRDGQTFLFDRTPTPFVIGADENGISRTSVLRFSQDYVSRQPEGAWVLRSQFSLGLDLLDATINEAPIPDGRFFSWLGQVQRVWYFGNRNLLILQTDLQLTPDSLLPSEQLVIGGGQSLRGYRQNVRSGDNGFRFSIEDQIALLIDESGGNPTLQLAPFIDMGLVWNHPNNPNTLPDQTFLASIGLGVLWEPLPDLNLRIDYALPLVDLSDRGNNLQDQSLYFSTYYSF
jgi:hemolysin activation/secretion protein